MKTYDLHVHSKFSYDGAMDPKEIIKIAKKRGLDGVAITDHDTIKGGVKAKEFETEEFKVIVGAEIKTRRGEILGLFLRKEIASRDPNEVAEKIRSQNGVVVIPHPFDTFRRGKFSPKEEDVDLIDCIEGFNARCIFQGANEKAMNFAREHRLGVTAGSDAHLKSEVGNGGIRTHEDNIKNAILQGKVGLFGKRSSPFTHIKTKVYSWWKILT
ncbi:MAG: PHP domain-containing protein [Candidatus Korarchaeota archaeon]|nr:PHP domain-containing protein [Candidatus Korarchaeota archaeon]NIU85116.1 PHP domain-containing protein [Candidatus Thorarchaeota archaeon]NIW15080.1 PHP domain-containing protein [Candidatus Thorarchaeota archaeon]NIW53090.1 PHP domain-containing protein [Candidatus Korarchaeota archaeon]